MGYTQKSAEEKKKEIDAALEKIENALPEVFTSKNFRDYLKFQSKFNPIPSFQFKAIISAHNTQNSKSKA